MTKAMSRTRDWRSVLDLRTVSPISLTFLQQPDFANVHLLLALLDETAAGIHVVVGERLLHLADARP